MSRAMDAHARSHVHTHLYQKPASVQPLLIASQVGLLA